MKHDKVITIYDLAKILNISASTVSRALNNHPSIHNKTKEKVINLAKELGYQQNTFASNLRLKRSNTIGVIVPRLDSYFMATVIYGIEKELNKNGYNLIISQSQESEKKEQAGTSTLFSSRVDGLIISLSSETHEIKHLDVFLDKNIPVVFFDRVCQHKKCTSVVIDNFKAGYEITKHLIEQGCKNIFHFTGNLGCSVYQQRYLGYKKALEENNMIYQDNMVMSEGLNSQTSHHLIKQIKNKKLFIDAIFTTNDNSAVDLICRLKEAGIKIPDDIAVAGFNNNPISEITEPKLTTINYPGEEMGEIAASTIIEQILKKVNIAKTITLKHNLIIRTSTLKKSVSI